MNNKLKKEIKDMFFELAFNKKSVNYIQAWSYRLPTTDYRLPVTDYLLLNTDYRLLLTQSSTNTHLLLLISSSIFLNFISFFTVPSAYCTVTF